MHGFMTRLLGDNMYEFIGNTQWVGQGSATEAAPAFCSVEFTTIITCTCKAAPQPLQQAFYTLPSVTCLFPCQFCFPPMKGPDPNQ